MDFLHALVDDLTGIAPKVCTAVRVEDLLHDVTLEKQCSAAPVIVQFIDCAAALRTNQILVCQEYLAQCQPALCMGTGTLRVCAGIDTLDALK